MPWDGVERRVVNPKDPTLQTVKDELESVRGALMIVAEGMQQFVSSDDLDKRIKYEKRQQRKLYAAIAFAAFIGFMSVTANTFQLKDLHDRSVHNRRLNAESQKLTGAAVNCILYSLEVHREANESAHKQIAADLGKVYTQSPELTPKPNPMLKTSCDALNSYISNGVLPK